MFIIELIAFRWGTAKLAKLGISVDSAHTHGPASAHLQSPSPGSPLGGDDAHGHLHQHQGVLHEHETDNEKRSGEGDPDAESVTKIKAQFKGSAPIDSPVAQILGIAILEFGVLLHRCVCYLRVYCIG